MNPKPRPETLSPQALLRRIAIVFAVGVAVVLVLGALSTRAWFRSVQDAPLAPSWLWIGLALALTCALTAGNLMLRWLRWHLLLRRVGMRLPARDSALLYMATLPALLTPLYVGELIRAVLLGRRYPRLRTDAAAVWLLERSSDLLILVTFAGAGGSLSLAILAGLLWVMCVALVRSGYRRVHGRRVLTPMALLALLALTAVTWLLPALALAGTVAALGQPQAFGRALTTFASSTVFGSLSGVPGGVVVAGSRLIDQLQADGLSLAAAVSGGFLFRLGTTWFAILIGLLTCVIARRRLAAMLAPARDTEHFDVISNDYAEQLPEHIKARLLDRKVRYMQRYLHAPGHARALRGLDLGCGHAWYAAEMARVPFEMCAVDVSAEQIANARRHLAAGGVAVDCRQIEQGRLPYPDGHFDFAYSINVFHHILDDEVRRATWREVIRVLKPGGVFFLHEVNVTNPLFRFYLGYLYPIVRAIDEGVEQWIPPAALPEVAGASWRPTIEYFTFLPEFLPGSLMKRMAGLEARLEASRWRHWSAHYMAYLVKHPQADARS
jgi:SAM-dependent methyltransferase